ncbi:hypothetical protein RhiirC2_768669 [Rhizophagus irregularis]|uniref:Crinkler effector protein N-terminal domain-containing protein n=1 Tax=Rhizophagus irregularis TaxID=588596 RepID=A0A2N1P132_9GLOM|nr:hypothetical protein RhiirC2_768669 [Rhizophagus irregularis]
MGISPSKDDFKSLKGYGNKNEEERKEILENAEGNMFYYGQEYSSSGAPSGCKGGKAPEFDHFPADRFKLWKVEIGGDHLDDQLKNLKLNGSDELSAIKKISKYFADSPAKEHIHVLVEPPASTGSRTEIT